MKNYFQEMKRKVVESKMNKPKNNDDKNNDSKDDTAVAKNGNDSRSDPSSIFYIMDGIIDQLNKTKKLFIIMILTVMIIPPIAFMLTFVFFGFPFHNTDDHSWFSNKPWEDAIDPNTTSNLDHGPGPDFGTSFRFLPLIPVIVVIVWLGIGIRQWFILSKWDKKYKKYKELQRKVDEKLDKD
jgi:NADH:ubiquinone oxidoreductase subunit 5 (subunit L)/multisubunit Na+/H+ antiporter MnhA subunit